MRDGTARRLGGVLLGPVVAAGLTASAAPPRVEREALTTRAERTGYAETGRMEEVLRLCAAFPRAFPGQVRCERFGTTPEGRALVALVASEDGVLEATAARRRRRPVVLLQGGIHAGEIAGKDAGFELLRELLAGRASPGVLRRVTVVFVPVLNVDGHERFGPHHRPNQNGPKATGWRTTSQNLNLNRDFAKVDAPETAAVLGLLERWEPILFADLHVTDGAKFRHDVAVLIEPRHAGPAPMREAGAVLQRALFAELERAGHRPVDFYPSFLRDDDPSSGFAAGVATPRFATGAWAARNRFGVLVEVHSWRPYAEQVRVTFAVSAGLVDAAAREGEAWQRAAERADEADAQGLEAPHPVAWRHDERARTIDFEGYAYTREPSEVSGKLWTRYDDSRPELWRVPYHEALVPSVVIEPPRGGYVVPAQYAELLAPRLRAQGIAFTRLSSAHDDVALEQLRVERAELRARSFEGRTMLEASGRWSAARRALPAGSLFVPVRQRRARLVVALLEPTAPDSFAAWGFFNAHLEEKEYLEDYVAEAFAREQLAEPSVRAAFDGRLADAAFAASPAARLRFFAERHPSRDVELGVLPVYRTDVALARSASPVAPAAPVTRSPGSPGSPVAPRQSP